MFEPISLPGVSDEEQSTLNRLLKQLDDRAPRNLLRASYYDGKRAIRQVGTVIPPQYYKLGLVLGWSGKAVDALARRCNLDGYSWADGDLEALGARELWDSNFLGSEISSGLTSAFIHGIAFGVNTVGVEGEPSSLIHVKDALSATGDWDNRRRAMRNLVSVTSYDDHGRPTSLALYLDGVTIAAVKDSSGWSVDRQDHPWGVPVEALVYKPRVGRPLGSSRISRPVMSLHDAALRSAIRMEGHMDVYSFPEMWMLGADESIFKNADGSQKASWQIMLGRIKGIPDDTDPGAVNPRAEVKQFPASSPEPHLANLNALAKLFAREASLPDSAMAITDVSNPTSAEAYDSSQYELIAEAEGATDDFSAGLRRLFSRGLAIQGGVTEVPAEWASIDAKWRNPRFETRAAQADAGLKQLQAMPWLAETSVGLELVGLEPQQIQRALAERRRAAGRGVLDSLRQQAAQAQQEPSEGEPEQPVTDDDGE